MLNHIVHIVITVIYMENIGASLIIILMEDVQ
jgi:hypothetical protein